MRSTFSVSLFGLALLAVLSSTTGCSQSGANVPTERADTDGNADAVTVTAAPVVFRSVQRYVGLVGTLYGYEEATIGAEVGGRVKRIAHDVADRVRPGEVLLEIDPTDYQLALRQTQRELHVELAKLGLSESPSARTDVTRIPNVIQARLRRENAYSRLSRVKQLVDKRAASQEELTEKTSDYRVAQAEYDNQILLAKAGIAAILVKQESVAIAQQQLADTLVHAPFPSQPIPGDDGSVEYAITRRAVSEGEYAMVGTELLTLVIENPLKFRGRVPERRIGEVRLEQNAKVFTSAYPEPFDGKVTRINPAVDPATRAFEVEILVPNPDGRLKPGGFAKTGILTTLDTHAATVPLESLVQFAGVTKIFLIEDGLAREVQVTLGMQDTDWVEIATPKLPDGAQVITSGQTVLADGTSVAVRGAADAQSPQLISEPAERPESTDPALPDPALPVARREATP